MPDLLHHIRFQYVLKPMDSLKVDLLEAICIPTEAVPCDDCQSMLTMGTCHAG